MRIKKLKQESCDLLFYQLNRSLTAVKNSYLGHASDFEPLIQKMEFVEEGGYIIDEKLYNTYLQQIILNTDGKGTYDFENAQIIYEMFADLSPMEANDERLWTRLTHDHFHKYLVERWMANSRSVKNIQQVIQERFFFRGNSQAARVRNGIARLWWIAHLTVNHEESDEEKKWALTKAICESQDFITSILERSLGSYNNVRRGILEYYLENRKEFGSNRSKTIQALLRDLNNYGGVSLLSMMNKENVKDLISELIQKDQSIELKKSNTALEPNEKFTEDKKDKSVLSKFFGLK